MAGAEPTWEIREGDCRDLLRELVRWLVRLVTPPGGLVLDPFLGSGTAIIACEELGRACVALELEPRFVDVSIERWEKATGGKAKRS